MQQHTIFKKKYLTVYKNFQVSVFCIQKMR